MRKLLTAVVTLFLVCICSIAFAASDITFEWDPNSEQDLAGYRLYQSDSSGNYTFGEGNEVASVPAGTEIVTLLGVQDGKWFWVLTAYDQSGNESGPSNEVSASLDTEAPAPPQNFIISLIRKIIAWITNLFSNFRVA